MSVNPEDAPFVRENGEEVSDPAKLTKTELLMALRQTKEICRTLRRTDAKEKPQLSAEAIREVLLLSATDLRRIAAAIENLSRE